MAILINGKKVAGAGAPGKSAYQAAVDDGYTGTESEFNSLLANGGLLCENLKIKRRCAYG